MKYRLVFVLGIIHASCFGQFQKFASDLSFNRYSTEDGLSHASINVIIKDSKGFTWIGTDDGLNRFDGNQFRIHKKIADDSTSLISNRIETLWEDSLSRIWIGTKAGLSIFDPHVEKFRNYSRNNQDPLPCLDLAHHKRTGRVWIAGGMQGLRYYDPRPDSIIQPPDQILQNLNAVKVELAGDILYVGTINQGLFAINLSSNTIDQVTLTQSPKASHRAIRALLYEGQSLWIGTEGDGLFRLNTDTKEINRYDVSSGKLSDNQVWALERDGDILWAGTDGGGLNAIDTRTNTTRVHRHSYYNQRSLSGNIIRCIHKDRLGDLWVGTFTGGISYLPAFSIRFHSFRKEPDNNSSLPHNSVLSFCETSNGTVFIGTDGGGLAFLRDGKFGTHTFPPGVTAPKVILSIHEDRRGNIWIGTYQDGLYQILPDKRVKRFTYDVNNRGSISSDIIWDIEEDNDGNMWFSTEVGLNRLLTYENDFTSYRNANTDEPKGLFTSETTQTLLLDSSNNLWIGYFGKLSSCYLPTGRMTTFESKGSNSRIPNKQVLALHLDRRDKNVIWFSSFGTGIVRLHTMDKKFEIISEENGLPGSQIYSIQTDRKGIVWLSGDDGIVRYHPLEKNFYLFETSFGVNASPFRENSGGQTSSGYIMFGGTNGFSAFWPADVNFQKNSLDVVFTGFKLLNEEVPIDQDILSASITETKALEIPYERAKFLDLEFSAPNFLSSAVVQYQYMLEGFEENWHTVDNKTISFTNLLPGKYGLKVKAGFPSGIWGDETLLRLTVTAPWWMRWYARVGLLLLVVGIGLAYYRYRTYSLNKRKAELETIVAAQNQEIRDKNQELAKRNQELSAHNEELLANRETISLQNKMLSDAQVQLREINQSLEKLVQQRTEKLNETISQLNKTIKELDAFLYSASHDLVSPLKSILGLVHLAKLENRNKRIESYFTHIEISVNKLEAIIQMLMQHSFNSKTDLKLEPVDLRRLIEETVGELRFFPEAERINFNFTLKDAQILSDAHRLKIVLSNLLGNAVKYHDTRKKENVVKVDFKRSGSNWMLEIVDNGIGIERDRLDRVFELFYRATESAKGSGLGLYIVKDTVDRLGGSISVDSEIGEWTKFTLSFPVNSVTMLN